MTGSRSMIKKHQAKPSEVSGLKMQALERSVRWSGLVRLHHTKEDLESLLAETRWPGKNGKPYFACASTGLLFDKQSGVCVQSTRVTLLLDSIKPLEIKGEGYFRKWREQRIRDDGWLSANQAKRGPKPKAQREYEESNEGDDDENDE